MKYVYFILGVFLISTVFASDYSINFNQFGDTLVIQELFDENIVQVKEHDLERTSTGYVFLQEVISPDNFDNFRVVLNLDKNVLADSEHTYPRNWEMSSNGEFVSLYWEYTNVSEGEGFAFFVVLNDNNFKVSKILFFIFPILVLGVVVIMLIPLFRRKKNAEKYLLNEEKKIIDFLKNSNRHESWQKKIQSELNLSKAKTSRLIRNLESRNIVEKIPFGNTNKIRLK